MRHALRHAFIRTITGLAVAGAASIATDAAAAPCLTVAMTARPQDRAALLADMTGPQRALLSRWHKAGLIAGSRLLFTRAADTGVWDAMVILTFADDAAQARWRTQVAAGSGGIAPEALSHIAAVETTPCDGVREGGPGKSTTAAVLVVPYLALIPPSQYLNYLDGYTVPQFRGWIEAGALDSYEIITSRYPAGRAWNATIILRYRDDAALARREEVTTETRSRLAANPSWKTFSDSKKAIRTEGRLAVADEILAE